MNKKEKNIENVLLLISVYVHVCGLLVGYLKMIIMIR